MAVHLFEFMAVLLAVGAAQAMEHIFVSFLELLLFIVVYHALYEGASISLV